MNTSIATYLCPECGKEIQKEFYAYRWSEMNYRFWSDGYVDGDGWFLPCYTHCCPACGKYYLMPKTKDVHAEKAFPMSAKLPLSEMKDALQQLADGGQLEAKVRLDMMFAHHDLVRYGAMAVMHPDEVEDYLDNLQWLLAYYTAQNAGFSELVFELHRLLGHDDECRRLLDAYTLEVFVDRRQKRFARAGIAYEYDAERDQNLYKQAIGRLQEALGKRLMPYVTNK